MNICNKQKYIDRYSEPLHTVTLEKITWASLEAVGPNNVNIHRFFGIVVFVALCML